MQPRRHLLAVVVLSVFAACGVENQAHVFDDEWVDDSQVDLVDDLSSTSQELVAGTLDAEELAFLKALNDYRVSKGLAKLKVSIALTRAADFHSADMAKTGKLSHTSSDGTGFGERVKRFYPCNCFLGENVAVGYATGASAFTGWKNSPGHDANMRSANFKVIGISRLVDASGRAWWTTDFGSEVDAIFSAGLGTIATNGGFESDAFTRDVAHTAVRTLNRWHTKVAAGGGATRGTAAAGAGSYGLRLTDPDPGSAAATQVVRAARGINYRVSAVARRNSGTSAQTLYLDFLDGSFARLKAVTAAVPTGSGFVAVKAEDVAPSGTKYVRVILWGSGTAGHKSQFDWDSVKLEAW